DVEPERVVAELTAEEEKESGPAPEIEDPLRARPLGAAVQGEALHSPHVPLEIVGDGEILHRRRALGRVPPGRMAPPAVVRGPGRGRATDCGGRPLETPASLPRPPGPPVGRGATETPDPRGGAHDVDAAASPARCAFSVRGIAARGAGPAAPPSYSASDPAI